MKRLEQLKILLEHPNTESNIVNDIFIYEDGFKVDYSIGPLKYLMDAGYGLKTYSLPNEPEPHCIILMDYGRKTPNYALKIRTAPMGTFIVGRKSITLDIPLSRAELIDPITFDAPIDGALLEQETMRHIKNFCEQASIPFESNKSSFLSIVCYFQYWEGKNEIIGSSFTDDFKHYWMLSPVSLDREL